MSSHHIVRDYQEPSLICWKLTEDDLPRLGELLEWSPVVVCHANTAKQLISWGIKVDRIFCLEGEEEELKPLLDSFQPSTIHDFESFGLIDILEFLGEDGQKAFNIYGTLSESEQEQLLQLTHKWDIVSYTKDGKGMFCQDTFEKWVQRDSIFELPLNVQMEGLKPFEEHKFKTDKDGFVKFSAQNPFYIFQFECE
ncbi:hypothetical protein [Sediminitomix flava]|uniref:Thiamine pyrophosphokinase n=1 Tax=Sediminitomix flava TaxID=379075 RepID=A0A315ZI18_SEDFL|nr:hypothetical protein [Sediminitomix flava]PWJ44364.1 hypothetical protein BC781_101714 [Sediminitomix flava]